MSVDARKLRTERFRAMDETELAERMAGSFEALSIILLNAADETRKGVKSESGAPIGTIFNAIRIMQACIVFADDMDSIIGILKDRCGIDAHTSMLEATPKSAAYLEWLLDYDNATAHGRKTLLN